jgi:alpha-D-xyloside xylohydrolase
VQGVVHARATVPMHYFFGTSREIYAEYLKARNQAGYKIFTPKYESFGVGWEAFGALGWETNQATDRESVDRYLALGYPLRWIVIGSGFWPAPQEMHETTSFGLWDKKQISRSQRTHASLSRRRAEDYTRAAHHLHHQRTIL